MAKHRPRAQVMWQPEAPDYGDTGTRITLQSLGLTANDPANPHIRAAFLRCLREGRDICDPSEQSRCIEEGRQAHQASKDEDAAQGIERTVYYLRVGRYIKIGTAIRLEQRLNAYPPDAELLATEPGHYNTEHRRLVEFSEYLAARREWFHPGPRLMAHIEGLRAARLAKAS